MNVSWILTGFNNDKAMIHYVQTSDGYVVTIKNGYAGLLQNLCENVFLKRNEQQDFMDAMCAAKLDPSVLNNDTEIFAQVFELRQEFPGIIHHIDEYYEH